MRRPGRATAIGVAGVASTLAIAIAAACTTFDGLSVPDTDAAVIEAGTTDAPVVDSPVVPEASTAPGYLPVAQAARLCSLVFQCPLLASSTLVSVAVPVDPLNYSLCMHWLSGPIPPTRVGFAVQAQTFSCMAQASTCAGAGSCLSLENVGPGDSRCGDAGPDAAERCADDGGTVLRCAQGYVLHCKSAFYAPGSQCLTGTDGTHWCALSANCSVQTSCIGPLLDYCGGSSNLNESVNCAYDGYTCDIASNDDSGVANCNTGNLYVSCTNAGTSCAGSVVDVCDGYQVSEFDCASLGGTCTASNGSAICTRSGDPCTPFDPDVNACSGTSLSLCIGGQKQQFDCSSVGLTCVPGSGAESGHCG